MSLKSQIRQMLKTVHHSPEIFQNFLHRKWPRHFGHQVRSQLVQLYKNDLDFTTALSFNHFIEFFSTNPNMNLDIKVTAWSHDGHSLGSKQIQLRNRGAFQILLKDLFPNLDSFGLFAVGMRLTPKYIPELEYLGTLSPQFMTIYIPTQSPSAPQMIHSHKIRQGRLLIPRQHQRKSSDIEDLSKVTELELYVLNSSASRLHAEVHVDDAQSSRELVKNAVDVPGYGVQKILLDPKTLPAAQIGFAYSFNRSVDHKKPILFRRFENGSISCNHT